MSCLLPFPYRDRTGDKARPAVVVSSLAFNATGDVIVAAITSHAARYSTDYELTDWKSAGLRIPSTVRMLLATIAESRVLFHVGKLTTTDWAEVRVRLNRVLA